MKKEKLYTLEEAQIIWTNIIKKRAEELEKDLLSKQKHNISKEEIYV